MPDATATWGQPETSLPFISKKDTLKRYRMRVEGVQTWREQEGYDDTWRRLRDVYRLKSFESISNEDRVLVAVAFATINVIEPSVAINHPRLTVTSTNEEEWAQSVIAESVINYWWRHYKIQKQIRRAVKDYLIYGLGWIKVGYRYLEGEEAMSDDELSEMHADLAEEADTFAQENPDYAGDLPTDVEIADSLPRTKSVTLEDRPFAERISPFDIYVDPEATSMDDARWIVQRVVRPIEEVKNDPRYRSSVRRRLESDGSVSWQNEKSKHYVDTEAGRVTLWEFYDIVRRKMCVFTSHGDDFLIDPVDMPYAYGHPFLPIMDNEVPDQFYPIGELEAIEPLQNELNETRTAMVRARKESIRKYVYHEDAFSTEGLSALRSDRDNTAVPVSANIPLEQAIAPLASVPVNVELFRHSDVVVNDIDRVSGVSEYQRGETPETTRTATEASIIQDAANSRAADKIAEVEYLVGEVGRYLLMLAQEYMTGEQSARKTGVDGAKLWFQFTREDIAGEFDFEVEAGSMQPKNDTAKRTQAVQMMQMLGPLMEGNIIDPRVLAEHLLRDGFGIKNTTKFIIPAPPADAPQPPDQKLVETMAYKDAPRSIQVQMEAQAGFQPSNPLEPPGGGASGAAPGIGGEGTPEKPAADPSQNGGGAQGPGGA